MPPCHNTPAPANTAPNTSNGNIAPGTINCNTAPNTGNIAPGTKQHIGCRDKQGQGRERLTSRDVPCFDSSADIAPFLIGAFAFASCNSKARHVIFAMYTVAWHP